MVEEAMGLDLTFKTRPVWDPKHCVLRRNSVLCERTVRRHHRMKSSNSVSDFELVCLLDI